MKVVQFKEDIIRKYLSGSTVLTLSKEYKSSPHSVYQVLKRGHVKLRHYRTLSLDESFLDKIDSHAKAYILGLLYTDGNNSKDRRKVSLGLIDLDVLDFVRKSFGSNQIIRRCKKPSQCQPFYRISFSSPKLSSSLTKLGCPPKKTFILRFPPEKILNEEFISSFILGCFDGDGSIFCNSQGSFYAKITGHTPFILQIKKQLLKNSGIDLPVYIRKDTRFADVRASRKEDVLNFMEYMYKSSPHKMERKYKKFLEFKLKYNYA